MVNILLCGGGGTRLWPLSRALMPKQFIQIFNNKSLFELSYERNSKICSQILIVSNQEQYFLALDQLKIDKNINYLLEPISKNTAAAITLACFSLSKKELVLVTPSDHLIKNESNYHKVVEKATKLAKEDKIITFGIKPNYPETGYGYIEFECNEVLRFCEKPDLNTAKEFIKKGNFLWNSGMFVFKVDFFLKQMQKYAKDIYDTCYVAYKNSLKTENFIKIQKEDMEKIPSLSIDYALMEKSDSIKVVPSDIDWSDVGSFESLAKEFPKNENENFSNIKAKFVDSKNNFIFSNNKKKFIATIDLNDFVIVDTDDALLISKKESTQKVRLVYESIRKDEDLSKNHLVTHRPWGTYTILEDEKGYKIKRIEVKPGKRLSLQKHFHRNEHWIVLSGTASVEVEGVKTLVRPNESTYIKMGQTHRLSNEGKIPVVLLEAQVGEYTKEDDIVRFEDDFERK